MKENRPTIQEAKHHPGKRPSCGHKGPCPLDDRCPMCNASIRVHDRAWLMMETDWGLTISANYCDTQGPGQCERDAHAMPDAVAKVLRHRKTLMSGARV